MLLSSSAKGEQIRGAVRTFIQERLLPQEAALLAAQRAQPDPWQVLPAIRALQAEARAAGLWNLFLMEESGLSCIDYAGIAEEMGWSTLAPELFNCNAPDTGNMELLSRFGSPEQKEHYLEPLLRGELRSAFCMTEPEVASSDATNLRAEIQIGEQEIVLSGRKWWSTGVGHPDCGLLLFLGQSDPHAHRHARYSIVLVPRNAPGVRVERMMPVFGDMDPPYGHGEIVFDQVRLPRSALLGEPGEGFALAQSRLGPGRIHHCMRCIGASERALQLMIRRAASRTAFGKPLINLGANRDHIAEARVAIEQARLLTLKAAYMIDQEGALGAMLEISAIKLVAPRMACQIIDQAMQLFGGAGLSADTPLSGLYAVARALRLADGPDEVHRGLIARIELDRQGVGRGAR